jgi:hypothetical protein
MGIFSNFHWKSQYIYYIFIVVVVVAFIASKETIEVPMWGTAAGVMFLLFTASDQSWKAFKKSGRAAILVSLKPSEGGHSTIHPDDISIAMSQGSKYPTFMVFATGGFVHGGVEWQGSENFVICPPEHVESTGAALICYTKLRRVEFEELQDYIQVELEKLKLFNRAISRAKRNIWFGMTSKIDYSSTAKNLADETKFLDQTAVVNYLKTLLKDRRYGKEESGGYPRGKQEQIVVNLPGKE